MTRFVGWFAPSSAVAGVKPLGRLPVGLSSSNRFPVHTSRIAGNQVFIRGIGRRCTIITDAFCVV